MPINIISAYIQAAKSMGEFEYMYMLCLKQDIELKHGYEEGDVQVCNKYRGGHILWD